VGTGAAAATALALAFGKLAVLALGLFGLLRLCVMVRNGVVGAMRCRMVLT